MSEPASFEDVIFKLNEIKCILCDEKKGSDYTDINIEHPDTESLLDFVKQMYGLRRLREKFLPAELFGEPAWDLLLDLYHAKLQDKKISVSSACIASYVPNTTALRWIGILENCALVTRITSESDQRVTWVSLTSEGERAMTMLVSSFISK